MLIISDINLIENRFVSVVMQNYKNECAECFLMWKRHFMHNNSDAKLN